MKKENKITPEALRKKTYKMKKENKSLSEELEELFGEAYEIGHAHGRGDNKYIDIGWHKPFKRAINIFKEKIQNTQRRLKEIWCEDWIEGQCNFIKDCVNCNKINKIFFEEFGRKLI